MTLVEKYLQEDQPTYEGYHDADGRFVPFTMVDDVFNRARRLQTRVLLRLSLNEADELEGILYTNAQGLRA